jgi:hypothetical protein
MSMGRTRCYRARKRSTLLRIDDQKDRAQIGSLLLVDDALVEQPSQLSPLLDGLARVGRARPDLRRLSR